MWSCAPVRLSLSIEWLVEWRTHQGGSVPRVSTERNRLGPLMTLNLCVLRRYCLGEAEGDLISTNGTFDGVHDS